ncbi:hypothetical protein BHM03_00028659 [Ensete ventricosum]|uniref:Uncharacterized protein n=1 Tax=Ensete ventricosum TaxID=4639 RepID=A0A445MHT1_ENSVE|nr:hypothetical protein BHM03_00028659 [Ensete ventricosum]
MNHCISSSIKQVYPDRELESPKERNPNNHRSPPFRLPPPDMAIAGAARAIVCQLGQQRKDSPPPPPVPRVRLADPSAEGGKILLQPRLCTLRSYGAREGGVMRRTSVGDASSFFASLADYIESSRKSYHFEIVSGRLAMVTPQTYNFPFYANNLSFEIARTTNGRKGLFLRLLSIKSLRILTYTLDPCLESIVNLGIPQSLRAESIHYTANETLVAFAAAVSVEVVTGNSIFKKLDLQQIAEAAGVCVAVVACAATFAWFSSARTRIGQMISLGCNSFVDALIDNIVEALFYDSELSDWSDEI